MDGRTDAAPAATAFAVLFLCFAFNMVGRGVADSYIVFLLPLGAEFGWNRSAVSSVYSIYLVVTGLAATLTGILFDRWGPRLVYPLGLAILGAGYLLAGSLTRLWQFQLCVGVMGGLGVSALGMIPASSLLRRWFRHNLSTAIGIAYAGFGSGTLVIVPLAQYLIGAFGWRDAYRLLGTGLLVLLPLALLLPWRRLAAAPAPPARTPSPAGEASPAGPTLRSAVRSRAYWSLVQVFFFTALAMFTLIVQVVAYLVDLGYAPLEAAGAYGLVGFLSVIGMIASGWLADRIGARATATLSYALTALGILALLGLALSPSPWLLAAFVLLFGITQGARGPIVSSLAARLFPGPGFATIFGTIFATMSLGSGLGSWMSGMLHDLTGGYAASLAFSLACLVLAGAPFWTHDALAAAGRPRHAR